MTDMSDTRTTAPAVHAYADGYGVWRAVVAEPAARRMTSREQYDAARAAIVGELADRGASPDYLATMPVVGIIRAGRPEWVESYAGDDRADMVTTQVCNACRQDIHTMPGRGWIGDLGSRACDDGRRHAPA